MNEHPLIALYTDFGAAGPYLGQMKAAIYRELPPARIVDLMADAPVHDPRAAAYLLASLVEQFATGTVFVGVVDPGVGDPGRRPAIVKADGRWFVGPDNGLFNVVARRACDLRWWDVSWQPPHLSASFHGRDLFAPVAARLAGGASPPGTSCSPEERLLGEWPDDLAEVIYIDHFGNAMTGLRATAVAAGGCLRVRGRELRHALTFSAVPPGQAFWYVNSNGLVEIAVNRGRAANLLGLNPGDPVQVV